MFVKMDSEEEVDFEFSGSESSDEDFDESSGDESDSSSSTNDDIASARLWCEIDTARPLRPSPPRFPFIGNPVINVPSNTDDAMHYIRQFIDEDFVQIIVTETNRYASQSHAAEWKDTTVDEMYVFIGLILLQSIIKKPNYQMYWTKNPILETPIFRHALPFQRFSILKKYLHFSNNSVYDPENHPQPKLNKVWPILNFLSTKFSGLCTPERDVTIDESLMLYKGRLAWVQYLPLKRAKFGIKTFILCESQTGYVWSLIVYTGKGTKFDEEFKDMPQSSQIVLTLMKPLLNMGYCLTVDNFYTSPQLADILVSKRTDIYGTVRPTRKDMPPSFRSKKLNKGEIVAFQRGKLTAMRWKDKRDVCLLSTVHNSEMQRRRGRRNEVVKPVAVFAYNDTMGGVDKVDQHIANNPLPRKRGKKYYKKIFFHLLDLAVWNAFILFKKHGGKKNALDFRVAAIESIFACHRREEFSPKAAGRPSTKATPLRLIGRHFPSMIPPTEKKKTPTRLCGMCSRV
ncbi:hypothetical protein ANN_00099 [Periplaneta americana]|uniref:PiggyBac transposable element-derived protein domain-containing protein n=1 Tax=Periplaneta americana TaxID=6978 RepID=A0ABQ8TPT8_PERAM|nr:hypothetical protein ANN_00099 [Periplaneta americana]